MARVITNRTYRYVAIAVMAAVAVLPAAHLACQALYFQGSRLVADHTAMCTRALGMPVEIGAVVVHNPGTMTYHDLRIIDPETNRGLVQCSRLEIVAQGGCLSLTGFGAVFHTPGTEGAFDRLQRLMQQSQRVTWERVEVHCPEAGRFQVGDQAVPFVGLEADCCWTDSPQTTDVRVWLPDRPEGLPLRATVTLRPSATGRQTVLSFDTGAAPVSHDVARVFLQLQTWLGTACRTQGTGRLERTADTQAVTFAGRLLGIDLATLAQGRLPVGLTGRVDLTVQTLRWRNGRLEAFQGELRGGPGGVDASLARLLPRAPFGFLWLEPIPDTASVPFETVGARLTIDQRQLVIQGTLPASGRTFANGNGVVLSAPAGPLLLDPLKPIPLAALRFWFDREMVESVKRPPAIQALPWWECIVPLEVAEDFLGVGVPHAWPEAIPSGLTDYVADLLLPEGLRDLLIP